MNRRSDAVHGFVKWPIHSKLWEDSGEGGLTAFVVFTECPKVVNCEMLWGYAQGEVVSKWFSERTRERHDHEIEFLLDRAKRYSKEGIVEHRVEKFPINSPFSKKYYKAMGEQPPKYQMSQLVNKKLKINPCTIFSLMYDAGHSRMESLPLVGLVYLGSTGRSLNNYNRCENGKYYQVGFKDLTKEGQQLVKALEKLYGTKAKFVTVLDT